MENPEVLQPPQQLRAPLCPHCRRELTTVAWTINEKLGLIGFYHNDPACMTHLNFQMVPPQPQRVQIPGGAPRFTGLG